MLLKNSCLDNALNTWMGKVCFWYHQTHLKTCLWMIVALIQTGEVNLTNCLSCLPWEGTFAQSRQRRIQRWLNKLNINIHRHLRMNLTLLRVR